VGRGVWEGIAVVPSLKETRAAQMTQQKDEGVPCSIEKAQLFALVTLTERRDDISAGSLQPKRCLQGQNGEGQRLGKRLENRKADDED